MRHGLVLVIVSLMASLPAWADEGHSHGTKSAPARKEQKPWGLAGDAAAVKRTIVIAMSDTMRFSPEAVEVAQGEVVRFVLQNDGKLMHEMVIGTKKELDEHAAKMQKSQAMVHEGPSAAHVPAGKKAELIWNFNRAGTFDFACLVPGHYQAGMVGKIKVAAAAKAPVPKEFTAAQVIKVDKTGQKISLMHEEIKNLGMPPMTMAFLATDPSLLDKFKAGDKVRFKAVYEAGNYVLVDIRLK